MATGKSGVWQFNSTSAQSYLTMGAVKFIWEEEYDIASNTSTVKITSMQLLAGGDGYGNQNYGLGNLWFNGSVKINGVVAATLSRGYNSVYVVPAYNEFKECVAVSPAYPWTVSNIAHDSDGSKSVDIVVDIFASTTNNNYKSNTNIKGSTSITLTTIPRSSSMSVSNGTLGTAQTISVTKSSDSFSHTITLACGTKSGTVCTKSTSTSISFTPSLDLATENTTGTSVSVTFTLQTYNGSTAIGSAVSKTVSMGIPSSVKPSCSISVSDPTGYSTTFGGYIQGKSKLAITVTPTLSYGSPISTYKTTANGSTYTSSSFTTSEISSSGSVSISSTVTDGRGRSGSATSTVTVIAYSAPSISYLSVNRCNADGTENQSGTYTKVTYSFAITSLSNKNSKTITLNYKKSSESSWTSVSLPSAYSATYAASIIPTDDGSSYDIQIVVQDYFEQTTRATSVSTAATIFHVHPSGNGFAFGKISEEEDCLDIGWSKVKIGGKYVRGTARNLLDNSDFRNPVNRRGETAYFVSDGYATDRWFLWSENAVASASVETGGIALNPFSDPSVILAQRFQKGYLSNNRTYTLAYLDTAGEIHIRHDPVQYGDHFDWLDISSSTWIKLVWAALYEGTYTAETLPEYQPKGYENELLVCHQYDLRTGEYIGLRKFSQPRNLLDNSDFRNPVNQRGITSAAGYIFDRWFFYESSFSGNVTISTNANGTTVTTATGAENCCILQKFIDKNYYDGKYTMAVKTTGGFLFGNVQEADAANNVYQAVLWFPTGTTIEWAALYEGTYTAETLPEYQPKGYGAELLECKRYFQKYQDIGFTVRNNGQVSYMLPVEMRMVPTFSYGKKSIFTDSPTDVSGNYPDWEPTLYPSIIAMLNNVYNGYATLQFSDIELNADL